MYDQADHIELDKRVDKVKQFKYSIEQGGAELCQAQQSLSYLLTGS